jgi:hypothetical protein
MSMPRPEADIARRITELEHRAPPDVMVWKPTTSASGEWEAMGDGWTIVEANPAVFADKLAAKLAALPPGYCGLCKRPVSKCTCV